MIGPDKYKIRGLKRHWHYNINYFKALLNDPEEKEFFFVSDLETNKTRISGKYKRKLIDFLLESQKYRATKFPEEKNFIFLQFDDILKSEIYVDSRESFREWLTHKTKAKSDGIIFKPVSYQQLPQVYKDFFSEEIAKKGFLFKCYFIDEVDEALANIPYTYVYILASGRELNDEVSKMFFSDSKID
ncbi:hypothetical protein FC52_GL001568 [Lactobacillus pasteurii DSM 23907 = CRBIP 24.76]|uniref:Uncharacterized protein n=1 Tax=Lactobacillus pasteurii DSM 23907 = CRBIP 24.76 TaxID=1423790 RepID=I7LAG9_9LACO|nr:hypothetical protein [Lactobacillus pasteurii]KRK07679.1 hypothetical protein FC52_GL001568 [Lactobacillus pasteurii DSM 23907 = CRBIP 24.76]TDG77687.1 hypothetical protein C5L33_000098 [Lactobacillus pasteurii]CCI84686.1 Protein of unknown function [Lactobacillus pasteurii DSM 23907 = CRBIP 24.76]